jgi:RimJ/RimL family protein N-acetyltransferase
MSLTIDTPRLRLRPFRESDLDDLARLYADPAVVRYLWDGRTRDRAATWREIAMFLGHLQIRGYATLAIEERATGQFLGECGPWYPEGWPMLEVGWVVDPQRQGEGIATEAARAVLAWCLTALPAQPICSLIHPDNAASARVATKLGARLEQRLEHWDGSPADVWLHRRSTTR